MMKLWIVIAVAVFTAFTIFDVGSESCSSIDVNVEAIENVQLDTTVHTPLATTAKRTFTQCIQGCVHIATCNKINFATKTLTCHFFNISGPETTVADPTEPWKALAISEVAQPSLVNAGEMCSENSCTAGKACFKINDENICADITT